MGELMRVLIVAFGVLVYLGLLATFAALFDFTTNLGVLRGIDTGPVSSPSVAVVIDLGLVALFGITHSVMARDAFKSRWTRIVPPAAERSFYVLVADACLLLLVWQWRPIPEVIWYVEAPTSYLLQAASILGLLILFYSTFLTNHFDLFGLRQVWLEFRRVPYTPVPFVLRGLYRWVRHPMMLGLTIFLWAVPTMTVGHALFSSTMTAYIAIGIMFEERGLARHLGAPYDEYRRTTPAVIPWRVPR
jgi:methanethiol S-methyltransferase